MSCHHSNITYQQSFLIRVNDFSTRQATLPYFSSSSSSSLQLNHLQIQGLTSQRQLLVQTLLQATATINHRFELRSNSHSWAQRRLRSATSMLNLFSLKGLSWRSSANGQEKVVLSAVEVESLRSEIAALEERESHYKAQLEHIDEILRSARLSGYLFLRTRWAALPGEPPPIDDTEVDDWLPRFVVLQGSCIYLYMIATDLSPQDSTLLSDVVEVGPLPCLTQEDEETRYCFYILTRHGLRYECSSTSKIQVDSWLTTLQIECKLSSDSENPNSAEKS
ncbi:hypothetical protein Salat_0711400 [Sesamum alatum]|uniref:PH domain-containing protein n=1 Tax=Sesamum alatum TaxID=300844 RepID=A0AAE1YRL4_9LAMI|nr:hypothetical protein Salat_0711400 [Sesamum alatum]